MKVFFYYLLFHFFNLSFVPVSSDFESWCGIINVILIKLIEIKTLVHTLVNVATQKCSWRMRMIHIYESGLANERKKTFLIKTDRE